MCGFAGVVAWVDRFRVGREILGAMSARIAHRGPDGEGVFFDDAACQVALAHRRLAILDPDPRSNQPFVDPVTGNVLVFNGEIYNFRELRGELSKLRPDYAWRTMGDTEVLLVAYNVWGDNCVERLNGMFALAVWDRRAREIFFASDRMGQKPLYFAPAAEDGAIAFASELPALRAVPWVNTAINQPGIVAYLQWGCFAAPATAYNGIFRLPAGCRMRCRAGRFDRPEEYFDPNIAGPAPAGDRVQATRRAVTEAVRRQLVADVPLGCFLSGGIDSSVIAAAMKASVAKDQPVLTFSIGFDDSRYDETPYAAAVAKHLGTTHHNFTVHPDAAADLPKLAAVFGEPFGDSSALPTHYLARETRQHVKVALSGDGGDELFGGYDRYRAMLVTERLHSLPAPLRALLAGRWWSCLPGSHPKSPVTRLKRMMAGVHLPPWQRYSSYMRLFSDGQIQELLPTRQLLPRVDRVEELFQSLLPDRDAVRAALAVDRISYLPDDLLIKVDRASMLHALEVRSPFMDPDVVGLAAGLSTDQLLTGGGKRMLRQAFAADLPAWVFRRRKMGFAVPIGDWLRNQLRPMLHDLLFTAGSFTIAHLRRAAVEILIAEHESRRMDHSQRLYALLMLELWWKTQGQLSPGFSG